MFDSAVNNDTVTHDSQARSGQLLTSVIKGWVLMCVILSAEYIQTIMMMEESVQHVVMTAIQEVSQCLSRVTDVSVQCAKLITTLVLSAAGKPQFFWI